ncbi:MAG: proton-conducting transporter membrane subunit [Thermodesulfobacteriota bacterium]
MTAVLLAILVAGPILFGLLAYAAPDHKSRSVIVTLAAVVTMAAGLFTASQGTFVFTLTAWGQAGIWLAFGAEVLVGLIVVAIGFRIRSWLISFFGLAHLGLTLTDEILRLRDPVLSQPARFVMDPLALILVLIVTIVGSLIALYAIGYMKHHEDHAPATAAGTGRFFFFLVGFLGVMNGLVLADSLQWVCVFWECTTLCSYFLIRHDGTEEAKKNARLQLAIGAFGGVAMTAGATLSLAQFGAGTIHGAMMAKALAPMALFSLGALTKSAQMPFQSWLLGAMVAPTPVSALLHSATMVKAGSYLILRLAPAYTGEKIMTVIALTGAFTFALAAALAIGQSNSKKVLAYSTISNLGLIVACAGINTPLAYTAALMILCFHAASKGLLFLCVGSIEQNIGSRDIEDMGGIRFRMPMTTVITVIGMASMLIPPFGMLLSKWMAIEASINHPINLMLIVAGSALTVVFWVKWMGRIQTVSYHPTIAPEKIHPMMLLANFALVAIVVLSGVAATPIHRYIFDPLSTSIYSGKLPAVAAAQALAQLNAVSEFMASPVLILLGIGLLAWAITRTTIKSRHVRLPYLCGENVEGEGLFYSFRGLKDEADTAWGASVYMTSVFQEARITFWANLLAGVLALSMFAVITLR